MSHPFSSPDEGPMYRHEETGEEIDPWSLFNLLNHRWWEGEPLKGESGDAWQITSPEDKAGVWRHTDA